MKQFGVTSAVQGGGKRRCAGMAGAAAEATRVSAAAAAAAGQQDSQVTKDAVATTVGVLIVWPALFLIQGDKQNAAQLAQLKGQMNAIEEMSIQKNCGIQFRQAQEGAPPPAAYSGQK